jgi:hypothetical protein
MTNGEENGGLPRFLIYGGTGVFMNRGIIFKIDIVKTTGVLAGRLAKRANAKTVLSKAV